MISRSATQNLAMLRWIAYIQSTNLEVCHILGRRNVMANMLSKARYESESDMVSEDKDVTLEFFKIPKNLQKNEKCKCSTTSTKASMKGSGGR